MQFKAEITKVIEPPTLRQVEEPKSVPFERELFEPNLRLNTQGSSDPEVSQQITAKFNNKDLF